MRPSLNSISSICFCASYPAERIRLELTRLRSIYSALALFDHRHSLHFEQRFRPRECRDRDERARREALATENLAAHFDEAVAVPRVLQEHGHRDHVVDTAAAHGLDRLPELLKDLAHLRLEVAGLLRGLPGEPDRPAAFGDDGFRIGPLGRRARVGRCEVLSLCHPAPLLFDPSWRRYPPP